MQPLERSLLQTIDFKDVSSTYPSAVLFAGPNAPKLRLGQRIVQMRASDVSCGVSISAVAVFPEAIFLPFPEMLTTFKQLPGL